MKRVSQAGGRAARVAPDPICLLRREGGLLSRDGSLSRSEGEIDDYYDQLNALTPSREGGDTCRCVAPEHKKKVDRPITRDLTEPGGVPERRGEVQLAIFEALANGRETVDLNDDDLLVDDALTSFGATGSVLELAGGTGWGPSVLQRRTEVGDAHRGAVAWLSRAMPSIR